MMSSDAKYRDRLDKLADELHRAREAQRKMSPGAARERRARQLDALERQQDSVRSVLGLPLCREWAEQVKAEELAPGQDAFDANRMEVESAHAIRRGGTPLTFVIAWIALTILGMATYGALVSRATWSPGVFIEAARAPENPTNVD